MAESGKIRAGKAFVEAGMDDSKLEAALKSSAKKLKAWGAAITGAGLKIGAFGAALMAPLLGAAKLFADTGSAYNDMSQRTGASVEALSELGYAAKLSGTDLETLEGGLRKMSRTIVDAAK